MPLSAPVRKEPRKPTPFQMEPAAVALTPKNELSREEKRAKQESAQQEALLREVDDAVRQSDAQAFLDACIRP